MALQLRMPGTTREGGTYPTLHEDIASGDLLVPGHTVTDREDVAQLQHVLNGELFVRVPRALPARLTPKE
ncbi:hypothetical protein [Streptomyces sp. NPDC050534]|uniref:hypothetical protein n=1 Tax=Streptomyces sp. NPDC050534 TaxID=3365625 RepID=UPI00379A9B8D